MNHHRNVRLTFAKRRLLVTRVIEQGQRPADAARSMGVSTSTVQKWLKRYHEEGEKGLHDRPSRPKHGPRATAPAVCKDMVQLRRKGQTYGQIAQTLGVSTSTVGRLLKTHGLNRRPPPSAPGYSPRARSKARSAATQALYQWFVAAAPMAEIIAEFEDAGGRLKKVDREYFREVLQGSEDHAAAIDADLAPLLDRPLERLDPVTRAVLHLALYELRRRPQLPWRIILDEAVSLARRFGPVDSYKYVNGVLDQAAHRLREDA